MKLLVAAAAAELQAFPDEIAGFERLVTGIGKLRAAVVLTQALERGSYEEIVVVGTAGCVDEALAAGVHDIGRTIQHDVQDLAGVVGAHVTLPSVIELERDGLTIATGDSFVDDSTVVATVRGLGASLIDMESFAFAWVASEYGVPLRIVRVVSDSAEDGATELWDQVVARCSDELWEWFAQEYNVSA